MKKNILVKLASIAAAVSLLVGGAYAAFTSNSVTITNVVLSSATPTLEVYNGSAWGNTTADGDTLGIKESNMIPGFLGAEHTFYLRNTSDVSVSFGQIVANLPSAQSGSWDALKDVVQMRFGETGTGWSPSGWYTLNQWYSGQANILLSNLLGGTQRQFSVQFQMIPGAGDGARGKTLQFTLGFVGMTP